MIESGKIVVKDANDKELECDILFTFDSDVTNKSYIVYTDNSIDDLGNIRVFANTYEKDKDSGKLGEVKTLEEWNIIEQIFSTINNEKEGK